MNQRFQSLQEAKEKFCQYDIWTNPNTLNLRILIFSVFTHLNLLTGKKADSPIT
jgi:hypothetical protein